MGVKIMQELNTTNSTKLQNIISNLLIELSYFVISLLILPSSIVLVVLLSIKTIIYKLISPLNFSYYLKVFVC